MPFQPSVKKRRASQSESEFLSGAHTDISNDANAGTGIASDTATHTDTGIGSHVDTSTPVRPVASIGIAPNTSTHTANDTSIDTAKAWENFDARAASKIMFNLRLNDRYYLILKHLADQDAYTSMQSIVKEILLPELERRAAKV